MPTRVCKDVADWLIDSGWVAMVVVLASPQPKTLALPQKNIHISWLYSSLTQYRPILFASVNQAVIVQQQHAIHNSIG